MFKKRFELRLDLPGPELLDRFEEPMTFGFLSSSLVWFVCREPELMDLGAAAIGKKWRLSSFKFLIIF